MTKKTQAELQADFAANLADNTTGDISPADLRAEMTNITDSFLGNTANASNATETAAVLGQLPSAGRETLLTSLLPDDEGDCLTLLSTLAGRLNATFVVVPDIDPEDLDPPPALAAGQLIETVAEIEPGVWSAVPTVPDEFDTTPDTTFGANGDGEPIGRTADQEKAHLFSGLTGYLSVAGGVVSADDTPDLGTPSAINLTNGTALPVSGITASTSTALGVGSVELGHASDTTLARTAAGRATIEGAEIVRSSTTQGGTGAAVIQNVVSISQGNYDGLGTPNATTLYVIV